MQIRPRLLAFCLLVSFPSVVNSLVLRVDSISQSKSPGFFVQLIKEKTLFHSDEDISFDTLKRAETQTSSRSSMCQFGTSGQFDVLRNSEVIKEFRSGSISRLWPSSIQGVTYLGFKNDVSPADFDLGRDFNVKDSYQIQAICGEEVSEPSEAFHIESWLSPVNGLQLLLRQLKNSYHLGERILIEATMRNVGGRPLLCPVPLADDGYEKAFWTFSGFSDLKDPRPELNESLFYDRKLKLLRPGESRTAVFALNDLQMRTPKGPVSFGTRPGRYPIFATVYFHDDPPSNYTTNLWRGEMTSNDIEIVIK